MYKLAMILVITTLLSGCEHNHKTYTALDPHTQTLVGCSITKVIDSNTIELDCGAQLHSYKYGLQITNN